jgi:hypothetical protein
MLFLVINGSPTAVFTLPFVECSVPPRVRRPALRASVCARHLRAFPKTRYGLKAMATRHKMALLLLQLFRLKCASDTRSMNVGNHPTTPNVPTIDRAIFDTSRTPNIIPISVLSYKRKDDYQKHRKMTKWKLDRGLSFEVLASKRTRFPRW